MFTRNMPWDLATCVKVQAKCTKQNNKWHLHHPIAVYCHAELQLFPCYLLQQKKVCIASNTKHCLEIAK